MTKEKKCMRCDKNMLSQEGIDNICKGCSLAEEHKYRDELIEYMIIERRND